MFWKNIFSGICKLNFAEKVEEIYNEYQSVTRMREKKVRERLNHYHISISMPFLEKFIGFRHAGTSIGCQLHKAESLRRSRYANWLWNIYIHGVGY